MPHFCSQGLRLNNGHLLPIYAGEFHYWRHDRTSWQEHLQKLLELGLTIVSTALPWNVHEIKKDHYDFSGNLDIAHFVKLAGDIGLQVFVRPGPNVNAQVENFAFPKRVLEQSTVQALSGKNKAIWLPSFPKMWPIPSYASTEFQGEVQTWFSAVAQELGSTIYPQGGLVAIQLDNEMQMFWRGAAFDSDYHPDALRWWEQYSGGQKPPRHYKKEDMPRILKWVAFKEEYMRRSLAWLQKAAKDAGLGDLATYHNLPPAHPTQNNLPLLGQSVDLVGIDFYDIRQNSHRTKERALYLYSSTELPFATELGIGGPAWMPTLDDKDQQNLVLGALSGGVKAFNLHMAFGRESWVGGIFDNHGQEQQAAQWLRPLLYTLKEHSFHTLHKKASIAVVLSRAEYRAAVASMALESVPPILADYLALGTSGHAELAMDNEARLYPRWLRAIQKALDFAKIPYLLIDENSLHKINASIRAVILPTLKRVDAGAWAALHILAETKMPVVIGPEIPSQDELGQPLLSPVLIPKHAGLIQKDSLDSTETLAADLFSLAGELSSLWIDPNNPDVDTSLFETEEGQATLLFIENRSDKPQKANINLPKETVLLNALSKKQRREVKGSAIIDLDAFQIKLMIIL